MKKINLFLLIPFLSVLLFSCGETKPKETDVVKEPKVTKISKTAIHLSDGSKIDFPSPNSGISVVFLTKPGNHDMQENGMIADLTPSGIEYANKLKDLLHDVDLHSAMTIGTRYAQSTARAAADDHNTKVYTFNNVDYGAFLEYVYNLEKGKKFLVVELGLKLPDMLYTLTAGQKYEAQEEDAYDEIYVIFTPSRGDATVHRLKI